VCVCVCVCVCVYMYVCMCVCVRAVSSIYFKILSLFLLYTYTRTGDTWSSNTFTSSGDQLTARYLHSSVISQTSSGCYTYYVMGGTNSAGVLTNQHYNSVVGAAFIGPSDFMRSSVLNVPELDSISGCPMTDGTTLSDCPRNGGIEITLMGAFLGDSTIITIQSQQVSCLSVVCICVSVSMSVCLSV